MQFFYRQLHANQRINHCSKSLLQHVSMMLKAITLTVLFVFFFSPVQAENYLRTDDKGLIYAKLNKVSLLEIKKILHDTLGIEFTADENIYLTELTMSFDGLKVDRAFNRLFRKLNFVIEYNGEGKVTEISIFSSAGGISPLPRGSKASPILSNNFKEIYAQKLAALQTLDHFAGTESTTESVQAIMGKGVDQEVDLTAFKVEPNTPPGGVSVIDPNSIPTDGTFKVERNVNPSGKDFQIVPSAPPSRKKK